MSCDQTGACRYCLMTRQVACPQKGPEMSEELFPRRRDVREMVEEVYNALLANYDDDFYEFNRNFLTGVRDLMRSGVPFADAVGAFAPDTEEDDGLPPQGLIDMLRNHPEAF